MKTKPVIVLTVSLCGRANDQLLPLVLARGGPAQSTHDITRRVLDMSLRELMEMKDGEYSANRLVPAPLKAWINSSPTQFARAIEFSCEVEESLDDFLGSMGATRAMLTSELWASIQKFHAETKFAPRKLVLANGEHVVLGNVEREVVVVNTDTEPEGVSYRLRSLANSGDEITITAIELERQLNAELDEAEPVGTQVKLGRGMESFIQGKMDDKPME